MRIARLLLLTLCCVGCAMGPRPGEGDVAMKVKREGNHVWLEGVEGYSTAEYASSVHGSQARILQCLGEKIDYDDLICYGAFAFRVGVHTGMCPSASHPCCGVDCMSPSNRSLPWKQRFFGSFPWSEPKEDRDAFEAEARAAVKDSIDRGVPVHYGSEEDGLIIGYADEGRRVVVRASVSQERRRALLVR